MPKPLKLILKIVSIALGVLLIVWLGIAAYVTINKKELLESLTQQINNEINGTLTIANMEPALIQGFPGISVSLKKVLLRDSLYSNHKHDLLKADEIFVALNVIPLLSGTVQIQKLSLTDGEIYLYTDSLGNSNSKVFKQTDKKKNNEKDSGGDKKVNTIEFKNIHFIQDNQQRHKLFDFDINSLVTKLNYTAAGWEGLTRLDLKVNSLAFNLKKGSFIKGQQVKAKLETNFLSDSGLLVIPEQALSIGEENFLIAGKFSSTESNSDFNLSITAEEIELRNVLPLLTKNISSKLSVYNLKRPIYAKTVINGNLKERGDPKIDIIWNTKENELTFSGETIQNCEFKGYFHNGRLPGAGFNDVNSVIAFEGLKGTYHTIPFQADTVRIVNLKKPIFEGRFQSSFALNKLNTISGAKSFEFDKGTANLNFFYRAPYNKSNSTEPYIFGTISLSNANLKYHPRNLNFTGIAGVLRFKGQDLFLENIRARSGSSSLVMQTSILNFLNFYYTDPKKIRIDTHIKSPQINLGEFLSFLGRRKTVQKTNSKNKSAAGVFSQLDEVFSEASVHLDVKADKLIFKKFEAANVHSSISLNQTGIVLHDVSLSHAEGGLKVAGNIDQTGSLNKFNIDTRIDNVNISKLFYAFENFGQDAIAYQNLRGAFTSRVRISGAMKESGEIVPKSFKGSVNFSIKNGAIVNFEPMQKVGNFAFPNRDFSNIKFTSLKNTFDINGNKVRIPPMYIQSSVLNLYLEGVYGMPTGTDVALRIPLRNPKRDDGLSDSLKRERFDNGIVINLRGQDDETGTVKFKLGKREVDKDREKGEKAEAKLQKQQEKELRKTQEEQL